MEPPPRRSSGSASIFRSFISPRMPTRATLTRAKAAEPLGYITKPFQEAELHASIEIALHKHREDLKVREKGALLASTLNAVAEGVISLDQTETITLFNPAAEAWTGWSSAEALGRPGGRDFPVGRQRRRRQGRYAFVARPNARERSKSCLAARCW